MRILSIGLDNKILEENSAVQKRALSYAEMVEKYLVVVPASVQVEKKINDRLSVFGRSGNKILSLIKIYFLSQKLINSEKINLITVQDQYFLAFIGWVLARRNKIALEIQVHGQEKYSGIRKKLAKFVIPKADAVRVVSQRFKKWVIDEFGISESKITVVPVYSELKIAENNFYKKNQDNFIFLTVGRLVPVKNISLQIKAIAVLASKYNNFLLWVAGDGPEMKALKKLAVDLDVVDKIKFLGWIDNLDLLYQKANCFILTSDYEGWGLAVVEAASNYLPIIMTDVGCAGELIENNKSGIVVKTRDQIMLVAAMEKIYQDDDLRKRLGESACEAVYKLPTLGQTLILYKQSWENAIRIHGNK